MTRLRLAPSSPERMAELIRVLVPNVGYGERATRGTRLLLRWFADGHKIDNCIRMPRECKQYRLAYRRVWLGRYDFDATGTQHWPKDGDARLKKELSE